MADLRRFAGPECLGRSVLVGPAQPAPEPWTDAPRVAADPDIADTAVARRLREAFTGRTRLVIETAADLEQRRQRLTVPWWELSPGVTLGAEVRHYLMTANTVDARTGRPVRFGPAERAAQLGAAAADTAGDVMTADGPVWCDGGPMDSFDAAQLDGCGLVPAVNLNVGMLTSLTPAAPAAELADDQQAAVAHLGGGACIVAPAGSGKTRVLTERVRWLVNTMGVASQAVCLVAYNVRARAEMQDRTADVAGLQVRTLNSLALAICNGSAPFARPDGFARVDVIGEHDVRDVLRTVVAEHAPRQKRRAMTDPLAAWIEALSVSRLALRNPAEVEADYDGDVDGLTRVAPIYAQQLDERRVVDFDHQIIRAVEILLADVDARRAAQRSCGLLLVDEFQDLTPAHLLLLRLLAGPPADVFGVGDDDQTIYGYSGASPRWLIDYRRWFPGAARHLLHVNYRCPPKIVAAASNLLTHNTTRIAKQISPRPGRDDSARMGTVVCEDAGTVIVEHVRGLLDSGAACEDIAVLTRVNSTLLVPQIALTEAGIDAMRPVGEWFLARTGVAAALAWLDLADPAAGFGSDSIAAAARRPPRGISPRAVGWIAEQSSVSGIRRLAARVADPRTASRVGEFAADVDRLAAAAERGADTRAMLEAIRDTVGLGASLNDRLDVSRRSIDRSAHGDDLTALISVASYCTDPSRFAGWLKQHLTTRRDNNDSCGGRGWGSGVRLATVHRVKGLEWRHVVVLSANDGLMPHRLASDVEEERRVFHVALTRCSKSVLVVSDGPPSPFIAQTSRPATATPAGQQQSPIP